MNASFVGSSLEFARFCCDQFNDESNVKGVLRRLVALLSDWYGVSEVAYITLSTRHGDGATAKDIVRFHPHPCVSDVDLTSVRISLQSMIAGDDEASQGVYKLETSGRGFYCAQFSEPGVSRGVLVWTENDEALRSGALIHAPDSVSRQESMDFIVRTAQRAAMWLRRLDNAQHLLYQDEVTGLYNYRYLDVALETELRRFQRFQVPFSLLFIDLDGFKQVNDVFGHLTGSSVLRQVGGEIKAAVRDVDSVIRYGGDEFVVVLLGANSQQAAAAAERVRSRVDRSQFKAENSKAVVRVTTSIGVACCPDHGRDKSSIIQVADETMYRAKNSGKNRVFMPSKLDAKSKYTPTVRVER